MPDPISMQMRQMQAQAKRHIERQMSRLLMLGGCCGFLVGFLFAIIMLTVFE